MGRRITEASVTAHGWGCACIGLKERSMANSSVYKEYWFNNFLSITKLRGVKYMGYRGRRSYDRGPREMHKAVCADCGNECEVPFKPTEGRARDLVYVS